MVKGAGQPWQAQPGSRRVSAEQLQSKTGKGLRSGAPRRSLATSGVSPARQSCRTKSSSRSSAMYAGTMIRTPEADLIELLAAPTATGAAKKRRSSR
jgi:hypothetical protein